MSTEILKAQAARLVKYLSEHHKFRLKQSSSLEAIAALHGMRNWNTLINCLPTSSGAPASPSKASPATCVAGPTASDIDAGLSLPSRREEPDARQEESNAWPQFKPGIPFPAAAWLPASTPGIVEELVGSSAEQLVNDVARFLDDSKFTLQRCGWRKGNRLYLLEIRFREFIFAHFAESAQGALRTMPRQGLHTVTKAFLRAMDVRGWLVTEEGENQVEVDKALWNLKIGALPWKGVVILEMPASMSATVEVPDTRHEVMIEGPLFGRMQALAERL